MNGLCSGASGLEDQSAVRSRRHTSSVDEAEQIIGDAYTPHRLRSKQPQDLDFELLSASSGRITVGRLHYGADVTLVVPPIESAYHLNFPMSGRIKAKQASVEVVGSPTGSATIFDPRMSHTAAWDADTTVFALKLDHRSLMEHISALRGGTVIERVEFPLGLNLGTAAGQSLVAAVQFLWQEMRRDGGIATSPILLAELEDFLMTRLLTAVPGDVSELLQVPARRIRREELARVLDYIDAHAHQPLSLAELSRIAMVGGRALQAAFRSELGVTPTAYVRAVRLDRVHADLREAQAGDSVTKIATRWGFSHMSRFATYYKQRFGVAPSHTLNR